MAKKKDDNNVGLNVESPKEKCDDVNCPFHGSLKLRGRTFTGVVSSNKMARTIKVVMERRKFVPKYERYEKDRTKIAAHCPDCVSVAEGDTVLIKECRPLSKTKSFCVVQKVKKEE